MKLPKLDVGLVWAKYVNTWGQVGSVAGTVNICMMIGVFYTTVVKPSLNIPFWLYLAIITVGAVSLVIFVLCIGISGYYRFFSKQSELAETNKRVQETDRKLKLIMDKLGIDDAE